MAHMRYTSRVGSLILASACVCAYEVSSGYSGFLPQFRDMYHRLNGVSKLSVL